MKKFFIIFIAIILCLFTGCSKKENNPVQSSKETTIPEENISIEIEHSQDTISETDPGPITHIQDDSNENLKIDATVNLYDIDNTIPIKYADSQFINIDPSNVSLALKDYLSNSEFETYEEVITEELTLKHYFYNPKNSNDYVGLSDNGAILRFNSAYGNALSYVFYLDESNSSFYNANRFENIELSFASKDAIIQEIKTIAINLGLTPSDECKIYSLTKEILEQEKDRLIQMDSSLASSKELSAVSEWEDCYYVALDLEYNELPLLNRAYSFQSFEGVAYPSRIEAVFTKDGLKMLIAEGYSIKEDTVTTGKMIPLDQAVNSLKTAYDLVILEDPININHISLCYMNWKKQLKPVYVFKGDQNGQVMWLYIDAISGEQVI